MLSPAWRALHTFGRDLDVRSVVGRDSDIWDVSGRYFVAQDPRYDGISPNDASNIRKLPNNHEGRGALDLGALIKARQINGHLNNGLPDYLNNGLPNYLNNGLLG